MDEVSSFTALIYGEIEFIKMYVMFDGEPKVWIWFSFPDQK